VLSVNNVALQLKVSDQHIRSLLRKGELKAEMVGKQWIIHQEAVDHYIKEYNIEIEPDDHPRKSNNLPKISALSFFREQWGLTLEWKGAAFRFYLLANSTKRVA
jgi:excisionase family DNA binding protein